MRHQRPLDPRPAIESCTIQLHTWKPFTTATTTNNNNNNKTLDPLSSSEPPHSFKRPCLSDRTSAASFSIDSALTRLSLLDDDRSLSSHSRPPALRWKRRRRCSRSVSGRSSDRSATRRRSYGTCSDLPLAGAGGTDSSGEMFLNGGDGNWGSDVSEASRGNSRREREERESLSVSLSSGIGGIDNQGNESGYGSEPGYRGDAELGYGDEVDTEEDDHRLSLWGEHKFRGTNSKMKIAGENTLQKAHHRCRRKKHDVRMMDPLG